MRASISKKFKEMPISDTEPVGPIKPKNNSDDVPKTIGDVFQTVRTQKKLDIITIAEALNISPRFLKAIEAMDIAHLPEKVYTLGFVRSYAKHLGVDPQKSVDEFRTHFYGEKLSQLMRDASYINETNLPSKKALIGSAIAIVILMFSWIFYKLKKQETPSQIKSTTVLPSLSESTPKNLEESRKSALQIKPEIPSPSLSKQTLKNSEAAKLGMLKNNDSVINEPVKVKTKIIFIFSN